MSRSPLPVRRSASFLAACVLAAAGLAVGGCRSGGDVPVRAASATATYVGDAACVSCHGEIAATYARTGMGRSMSRFDPATAPERFGGAPIVSTTDSLVYDAFVEGDSLVQRERRVSPSGVVTHELRYAAAYVVGSGNATRSYLMNVNGHLTEMPLTWYAERAIWDLSPGYRQTNLRFDRPVNQQCVTCHTATPVYSPFTQAHYETPIPLGISCEQCHGPASRHVESRLAGTGAEAGEADPTVVNPARLDRGRQLAVCQQCHLSGTTVFRDGHDPSTFRPGQAISESRVVYVRAEQLTDPEAFGISSHAQRLAESACFKASAMTCTTCHDPHVSAAETGPATFSNTCRSCHTAAALPSMPGHTAPASAASAATSTTGAPMCPEVAPSAVATANCVSCHMQAAGTSDIPHVTFTDHWIRRRLPPRRAPSAAASTAAIAESPPETAPLRLVRITETGDRDDDAPAMRRLEDAAATFAFYETTHRLPAYLPRIAGAAREGLAGGADLAAARLAFGRALMLQDSLDAAVAAFDAATARYPSDARLHYWRGTALRRLARPADAASALRRAVEIQPRFVEARLGLAAALAESGDATGAEAAYRAALADDPVRHAGAWNDLGFLLLQQQRMADAAAPLDRAVALDPDLTLALVNLGSLRLALGDGPAADLLFGRALRLDPANTSALANRGILAAQAGRFDEARALFRRVVALDPTDTRAQAVLGQLEGR